MSHVNNLSTFLDENPKCTKKHVPAWLEIRTLSLIWIEKKMKNNFLREKMHLNKYLIFEAFPNIKFVIKIHFPYN